VHGALRDGGRRHRAAAAAVVAVIDEGVPTRAAQRLDRSRRPCLPATPSR
jgi:hypothetical protein